MRGPAIPSGSRFSRDRPTSRHDRETSSPAAALRPAATAQAVAAPLGKLQTVSVQLE